MTEMSNPVRQFLFTTIAAASVVLSFTGCSMSDSSKSSSKPVSASEVFPDFVEIRDLAASATSPDGTTSLAFNVPLAELNDEENALHIKGDVLFSRKFSTETGVGPAFNAASCIACHQLDGRGALPILPLGEKSVRLGNNESLLLRMSLEKESGSELVPGFSDQLYNLGIYELRPESPGTGQADIDMSFTFSKFTYPDGRVVELRKPVFTVSNAYDAVNGKPSALDHADVRFSPRIGPPMIGLGLLEAIDARDILALADPDDKDGDGISGRANIINGQLGRFGWKANVVDIRTQVAAALSNDMGLRTSIFPFENIENTPLLKDLINRLGARWNPPKVEMSDENFKALEFYTSTLSVPARRNVDDISVKRGGRAFEKIACTSCHTPKFRTSDNASIAALRGLEIYPFSDGLLHDMGEELADGRRDHMANGREWKTRPLWGVGMTQVVNPRAGFLHDGRARTLEEAILYHGGEAAESRRRFVNMSGTERQEILAFLRSL